MRCRAALLYPAAVCSCSRTLALASLTLPCPQSTLLSNETVQHFLCVEELKVVFPIASLKTRHLMSYKLHAGQHGVKMPIT